MHASCERSYSSELTTHECVHTCAGRQSVKHYLGLECVSKGSMFERKLERKAQGDTSNNKYNNK